MSDDLLRPVQDWANGILTQLSPTARSALARDIAKGVRQTQAARIAAQLNTDGSSYTPRSTKLRGKKGSLRKKMFAKLRTAKFLKAKGTADSAVVDFVSYVERLTKVHHYGLRDRVTKSPSSPEVQYPVRQLLGLTEPEVATIRNLVIDHLAK